MEMMKDIHLEIRKWSQKSTVADYQLIRIQYQCLINDVCLLVQKSRKQLFVRNKSSNINVS